MAARDLVFSRKFILVLLRKFLFSNISDEVILRFDPMTTAFFCLLDDFSDIVIAIKLVSSLLIMAK
jgi:hypothetical protein